jgi:hypothetical protein
MSKTPSEVYQAMSASNILIAILQSQKTISVPLSIFLEASQEDQQLNVEYDENKLSFIFKLREKIEQPSDNQDADAESNT